MTEISPTAPIDPAPAGSGPAAASAETAGGVAGGAASAASALLHMPPASRSISLTVLALLGSVFMLHWAQSVFIPLMLGVTLSYALGPTVQRLQRLHVPRAVAAALVMVALTGGTGWVAYSISDDANSFIESLPDAAQKLRQAVRAQRSRSGTTMDKVQRAATQIEQAAAESGASPPGTARGVTRVQIERAQFSVKNYLWSSMPGMVASIGQGLTVVFITFFLLASGDTFRRKIVRLAGPTFARRKVTTQALNEITAQIQRYLMVQILLGAIVGIATWLAYLAIGVEHAAVWGLLAFLFNFVPYIGSVVVTAGSAVIGFVQFGSIEMALLVAGVSLALHTIVGNLLAPWLTGRANRLNAVTVFVGILFFGWLWGVWGLLLGIPMLLMVKTVCDRVDDLKPVGEMLGA